MAKPCKEDLYRSKVNSESLSENFQRKGKHNTIVVYRESTQLHSLCTILHTIVLQSIGVLVPVTSRRQVFLFQFLFSMCIQYEL